MTLDEIEAAERLLGSDLYGPDAEDCERFTSRYGRALLEIARAAASKADTVHASDCATHNEPAYPNGPCDCGAEAPPAAKGEHNPQEPDPTSGGPQVLPNNVSGNGGEEG